ncbi:MAG: hypothetical protein QNK04_20510 [Myxococcota bacterium]|nr:hypothetical protein [Myxococcota bacterium]
MPETRDAEWIAADRVVFSVAEEPYTLRDALLAAALRGEWSPIVVLARAGLACEERARREGEPLAPGQLAASVESFRESRGLQSEAELQAWLVRCGLSPSSWTDALRRELLRSHWEGEPTDGDGGCADSEEALSRVLLSEVVVSGAAQYWCEELAVRAALGADERGEAPSGSEVEALMASEEVVENLRMFDLSGCGQARREAARLATLASLELKHRRWLLCEPPAEAVAECVATHRLDWLRFESCAVAFPNESMAREASLRVREDGDPIAVVAADARLPAVDTPVILEELDSRLQSIFLGAKEGDVVGPVALDEKFVLFSVLKREPPSVDDAAIRARAEERIRTGHAVHAVNTRVVWAPVATAG